MSDYSIMSPGDVEIKVMERLLQLLHKEEENATRVRRVHKTIFARHVKYTLAFGVNDTVYLSKTPTVRLQKDTATLAQMHC